MKILRIKKKEFDLIKAGTKKVEWRQFSKYNKQLLFSLNKDGKYEGNPEIKEIKFINGYGNDNPSIIVEVESIRLIKFLKDIEIPEDNFSALEGQFAIEIKLGKIKE